MNATQIQTMEDVGILDTLYLIDQPKVPRGDVTLVFGEGAIGKGRLIWSWIAEVINGDPDAVVIGVWPEDHPNEQVARRLRDAGVSDPSRVVNLTRLPNGARCKLSADLTHTGNLGLLRQFIADIADTGRTVKMIILDPLASVVGWGSIQVNAGARRLLEPLQDLCMDTGIAGIVVAHTVASGKLQGSMGLSQAARLVYRVSADPADPATIRLIHAEKSNNLPATSDLRFTIESDDAGCIRVVVVDSAEAGRRQRSWREPRESQPVVSSCPAAAESSPGTSPSTSTSPPSSPRRRLHSAPDIAALLSPQCPVCGLPSGRGCTLTKDPRVIPVNLDPVVAVHEDRVVQAWLDGRITEADADRALAA